MLLLLLPALPVLAPVAAVAVLLLLTPVPWEWAGLGSEFQRAVALRPLYQLSTDVTLLIDADLA